MQDVNIYFSYLLPTLQFQRVLKYTMHTEQARFRGVPPVFLCNK